MQTEADRRLYQWAEAHDGVFNRSTALDCGLTHRQIERRASGPWIRLYQGVYAVPGAPLTSRGVLRAACLAGAPHAAVSHRSAAAYYDVRGGSRGLLELTCPRWLRTIHTDLVIHERSRIVPGDIQLIDDLPVYRPECVALQLAGIYRSVDFIEAVLQSMRRQRLITYESTHRMFVAQARRGVRGTRVMRAALELWNPTHRATDSEMETLLLQTVRGRGFPSVVPQYEIFDHLGRFVARVDAAIVEWKAAVDYDSKQEHSDEFQIARDNSRRNRILAAGWTPIVARHRDLLAGGDELVAAIRAIAPKSA
ncbi:MAG: hypothetical protein ACRDV7_03810 [Acidimicrobiia bacterium]